MDGCRWVGETDIIPVYIFDMATFENLKVDYIMHGDDVVNDTNGENMYTPFMKIGKYKFRLKESTKELTASPLQT